MSYTAGTNCPEQDTGNNSDALEEPMKQNSGFTP